MPYIKQSMRGRLDVELNALIENILADPEMVENKEGVLNYIITMLVHSVMLKDGIRYKKVNDAIGVLECAKLELYRRAAAPYEDEKAREQGDVP